MKTDRTKENRPGRPTMPAGKVLIVLVVGLVVWTILEAPTLKRSAEASPEGVRRTVALAILRPIASFSDAVGAGWIAGTAERAAGKNPDAQPGGSIDTGPEPLPSIVPTPGNTSPTPASLSAPIRTPTSNDKLRVVIVGDSLGQGLATAVERTMNPNLVRVSRQARLSTGLARPDYFNWPKGMKEIEDRFRPDLVVVLIGENDNQTLRDVTGRSETDIGTYSWPVAYEERVREFIDIATAGGSRVVWVGLPIQANHHRWSHVRLQNEIFERVADETDGAAFVDAWELFSSSDGSFTPYFREPNGSLTLARTTDGLHFTDEGYDILARAVFEAARDNFELTPEAAS